MPKRLPNRAALTRLTSVPVLVALLTLLPLTQTSCKSVEPGQNAVLVNVERSEQAAFDTLKAFLEFENDARDHNITIPAAHQLAETLRAKDPITGKSEMERLFDALSAARATYKATSNPGDLVTVEDKLAYIQSLARQARTFVAMMATPKAAQP